MSIKFHLQNGTESVQRIITIQKAIITNSRTRTEDCRKSIRNHFFLSKKVFLFIILGERREEKREEMVLTRLRLFIEWVGKTHGRVKN